MFLCTPWAEGVVVTTIHACIDCLHCVYPHPGTEGVMVWVTTVFLAPRGLRGSWSESGRIGAPMFLCTSGVERVIVKS